MLKLQMSKYLGLLLILSVSFNLYFLSSMVSAKPLTVVVEIEKKIVGSQNVDIFSEVTLMVEESIYIEEPPIKVEVLSERELIDSYILEISELYGIDKHLIHSIIFFESSYNPKAINSSSGCIGLMQICTKWHMQRAEKLGVTDFSDAYSSILVGVDYISELMNKHKDETLVLMLYSGSHKRAFELHKQGLSTEYVKKVLKRADDLRQRE